LRARQVRQVAMESTGVYWRPVWIHHAALRASTGTDENGGLDRFGKMEVDPLRNKRPVFRWR
jgi:hypothetical protein